MIKIKSSFIYSTEFISQSYNIIKSKIDKELCVSDGHWYNIFENNDKNKKFRCHERKYSSKLTIIDKK